MAAGCDLICLDCPPPERTEIQRAVFESLVVAAGTPALPSSRLADAERRHLETWLWFHIPFSVATLILMVIHMFSVWYY